MEIRCLADVVRVHAAERPVRVALELDGTEVTWAGLDRRTNQVAAAFEAVGVGPQERVALIDKNSIESYEVVYGLAKCNAVAVNVNWRLAPAEMAHIIEDAHASVVVVGAEFFDHVKAIEADLSRVKTIVAIGGGGGGAEGSGAAEAADGWLDYATWVDEAGDAPDRGIVASADDVCYQLYTSGTTGLPKGVMLSTANVFTLVERVGEMWKFMPGESVNLAIMPLFHIGGLGWAGVGMFFGCKTVILRDIDPAQVLRVIEEQRVTHAFFVPAVIQFMLLMPEVDTTDFSSLETVVYGASPITDATLQAAIEKFRCDFVQVYGLTETTGAITQLEASDHDPINRPDLLRSCGKPYPWVEFRVVNGSTGEDVPTGEVGEFWTRSGQNMVGYWNNPEATAATVTPDGWLKTGDAGYTDADGFLYIHDRVKDMVVTGGENVYPAEVENVLARHPAVADVAVVGVPDERWGEAVKAIVVKAAGADVTPDELIAFARESLAGFKVPKSVDFADELPRNPTGKLLKRELRAPYWEGATRQVG